jgi:hypothetical protein
MVTLVKDDVNLELNLFLLDLLISQTLGIFFFYYVILMLYLM